MRLRVVEEGRGVGEGEGTMVFVHGWPDTYHSFDKQVEFFKERYRCLRIVMPFCGDDDSDKFGQISGDGKAYSRWGYSFEQNAAMIAKTIEHHAPNEKVILVVHDWGVHWGGTFQALHPELVSKMVVFDVEVPKFSRKRIFMLPMFFLMGIIYQYWAMLAWFLLLIPFIGSKLGNGLFRFMANTLKRSTSSEPIPKEDSLQLTALCCYPYFYFHAIFFMEAFHLKSPPVPPKQKYPSCPCLFLWGAKKAFPFHSPKFLDQLQKRKECMARPLDAGHWLHLEKGGEVNKIMEEWLKI